MGLSSIQVLCTASSIVSYHHFPRAWGVESAASRTVVLKNTQVADKISGRDFRDLASAQGGVMKQG
jgi:hypothetical protein